MTGTLLQAYLPLFLWTGLGLLSFRWLPDSLPRLLGRSLYWVGVPVQIFTLARQTDWSDHLGLAPLLVLGSLLGGLGFSWLSLQGLKRGFLAPSPDTNDVWQSSARQGSFILASMLGNTGFVGLAIAPTLIDPQYMGWLVFYSVTQNVIGTYGIGVFLSSYYGRSQPAQHWLIPLRDVLTVPSLWAFTIGTLTRPVELPAYVDSSLHASLWLIIPCALLLMGIRLRQLKGWQSLRLALVPTVIKVLAMPIWVACISSLVGLPLQPRLALVLMAGMPSAFAGLILAEEYELDREMISSSIVLTTLLLLLTIPLWLWGFGAA